ncbi:uncharacterized protein F4807DRAFT_462934 [Annulohypoxylon truncatum]|uniref:uncharacterized protein n=1 Tax=Annulohypoxylon truncatum TaxID=327061 RepID=UPI00200859B8|nr:uncharacterized protein F4807DRAFT_462934 [Annulohypoxylon truncatum]KAI1207205.1 hypothetical protein F4807DRAFT_462934 [Annulohypoxylon truncatum]
MADLDPFIIAAFGPPPAGVDLTEQTETRNDIITAVTLFFAILSVVLRWTARRLSTVRLQADDYVVSVALVLCIVTAILNVLFGPAGSGHHVWSLTREIVTDGFRLGFVYTFMWALTVSVTKLSIILLYRRLFVFHRTPFRTWLNILVAIIALQILAVVISNVTVCRPLDYLWNRFSDPTAQGSCFDQLLFLLITGIINACIDLILLITPIPQIMKLELSIKKRVGVCGIMLLGCLVCIASWIRVYYLVQFRRTVDTTWMSGEAATWSSIESSFGIVSACLPTLRPLYLKVRSSGRLSIFHPGKYSIKASKRSEGSSNAHETSRGEPHNIYLQNGPPWKTSGQQHSEDAINLTNFVVGHPAQGSLDNDRIVCSNGYVDYIYSTVITTSRIREHSQTMAIR